MRKLRLYLDTSVFGGLLDADLPHRADATGEFFGRLQEFEAHVSLLVLKELAAHGDITARERLLSLAAGIPVVRADGPGASELVDEYLRCGAMPASARTDAVHVAAATTAELDALVSWNMRHLVKHRTPRLVAVVNASLGYRSLDIVAPEEL